MGCIVGANNVATKEIRNPEINFIPLFKEGLKYFYRTQKNPPLRVANNRLKWLPVSLVKEGAAERIPSWEVATNEQWDDWWQDSTEILGDAKWAY
jgi:hypothetical protein